MGDVTTFYNCWISRKFCLTLLSFGSMPVCSMIWCEKVTVNMTSYGMLLYLAHSDKGKREGGGHKWGDLILIKLLMEGHGKGLSYSLMHTILRQLWYAHIQ